jgi:large subunit ribosomal protein L18
LYVVKLAKLLLNNNKHLIIKLIKLIMSLTKQTRRVKIHKRIRNKITGTAARPRLAVYRSNKQIYAQIIDDVAAVTLVSASSREEGVATTGTKCEISTVVGQLLAKKAVAAGITSVVFDRSGYLYHGRIKQLADGAREGGLKF